MTIEENETGTIRRSVILVAAVAIAGLAVELVIERHWSTLVRFVPWIALAALAWAVFRLWRGPTPREIRAARWIAVAARSRGSARHRPAHQRELTPRDRSTRRIRWCGIP